MKQILHFFLLLISSAAFAQTTQPTDSVFKSLKYRCIGPFRGGRSNCVAGVPSNPLVYYMGTTGGGLWKTDDAGMTWKNISDGYFKTGSVGAIAVADSDPQVLYCGMGEHAPRGVMSSYGDGVYKSTDGGKTWKKMGLEKTSQIARIVIHPKNPDIVYVAAQGAMHAATPERGIYQTTDGGKTWTKLFFINNNTGCAELSMDKTNPNVLYASMWHHLRLPWKMISGGEGSGLYKSTDGGATWEKMKKGLPAEFGKSAVCVSRANSSKLFAVIEGDSQKEEGGLFISQDAGKSWSKASSDHRLVQRAWYYTEVFDDPINEHALYVMSAQALHSFDDGKTWSTYSGTHGDYHDLWVNPTNPKNMVIGNDGGASVTFNGGESWSTQDNMPTAQIYRVNADNVFPYNIYGGQQDNTSVKIASIGIGRRGITERDWSYSAGGESAFLAFDPNEPTRVMGGSYLGTIELFDTKSVESINVMAEPIMYIGRESKAMKYRYNWNAPIIRSAHEPNTYYHAAQLVLRTDDFGKTWKEISPDLTRNDKNKQGYGGGPYTNEAVGAENYGTISYLIESPTEKGMLWSASDDGLLYLTKDGGSNWTNVTPKDLPECLINAIELSPHQPSCAYIAATRYKFNDHTPLLFKTTDYGKTWTNISANIPYGAYTRVVREDKKRKDLLYAGTETGLYISWNGGQRWELFQLNLPVTPITDLMLHQNDLLVATAGRSFWVLDDIHVLQQYQPQAGFQLFSPEDAVLASWHSDLDGADPDAETNSEYGTNPSSGVVIHYQLPKLAANEHIVLTIKQGNKVVRQYSSKKSMQTKWDGGPPLDVVLSKKEGINRLVWDKRHATLPGNENVYMEGSYKGRIAIPGEYTIELKKGSEIKSTTCRLKQNPLSNVALGDASEYNRFMDTLENTFRRMMNRINALHKVREQAEKLEKELAEKNTEMKQAVSTLKNKLVDWDANLTQRKSKAYDDIDNFENKLAAHVLFLINQTENPQYRLNEPNKKRYEELMKEWKALDANANTFIQKEIPELSDKLKSANLGILLYNETL